MGRKSQWTIRNGATRNVVLRNFNRYKHDEESIRNSLGSGRDFEIIAIEPWGADYVIRTNCIIGAAYFLKKMRASE